MISKVVIVSGGYAPGLAGAEFMAWGTARELAARGHHVVMAAAATSEAAQNAGIAVLDWRAVRDGDAELPWVPDLVHAFDLGRPRPHEFAAELAARNRVPLVLTPATHEDAWPQPRLAKEILRDADAVLALTRAEAESLRVRMSGQALLEVIGQAADRPAPPDPAGLRRTLALHGPVVLFLGRRLPSKGFAELLVAAELIRAASAHVHFVFAGPGQPGLSAPGVIDLGLVGQDTKANLLGLCDIVCLPSRADVFPLVFIESWFLGKPVISGDFAGAGEVIRDGVDGLITTVDPGSIAGALRKLIDDPDRRTAMGRAGQARAEREFTWPALISRVERAYRLARRRGRSR